MILRLFWRLNGEHVRVRIFIAHQPFEDGAFAGELTMHMREFVRINQMDFQTEYHEEGRSDPPPQQ